MWGGGGGEGECVLYGRYGPRVCELDAPLFTSITFCHAVRLESATAAV